MRSEYTVVSYRVQWVCVCENNPLSFRWDSSLYLKYRILHSVVLFVFELTLTDV